MGERHGANGYYVVATGVMRGTEVGAGTPTQVLPVRVEETSGMWASPGTDGWLQLAVQSKAIAHTNTHAWQ